MNKRDLKFKRQFPNIDSDKFDEFLNGLEVKLPDEYVLFLKENVGGYLQDDIAIKIGEDLHEGIMLLGFSSPDMSENLKYFNVMRKNDPVNLADRYFSIMIIDGGEICIDTLSGGYSFFDASNCEFSLLCLCFSELLDLFVEIK